MEYLCGNKFETDKNKTIQKDEKTDIICADTHDRYLYCLCANKG